MRNTTAKTPADQRRRRHRGDARVHADGGVRSGRIALPSPSSAAAAACTRPRCCVWRARSRCRNYMVQTEDGQWRLGPAAGWLGARYQAGFDVNNVVEPTLHDLVRVTGESASFYVREGDIRSCIARVEGPQSVRHNVRIGERLPLNKGAPGRVILGVQRCTRRAVRIHPRAGLSHLARRARGGGGQRGGSGIRAELAPARFDLYFRPDFPAHRVKAEEAFQGGDPGGEPAVVRARRGPVGVDTPGGVAVAPVVNLRIEAWPLLNRHNSICSEISSASSTSMPRSGRRHSPRFARTSDGGAHDDGKPRRGAGAAVLLVQP